MKKIMIVNTSMEKFGHHKAKTGLWLSELVHFYDVLNIAGFDIDLFNTSGGETPIDPMSLNRLMLDDLTKSYLEDPDFMALLNHSRPVNEAKPTTYDCIYFTGGHGVMYDFTQDKAIKNAVLQIYEKGGIVAAVCHGIAGLLNIKQADGTYFISGKSLTGFSNLEEVISTRIAFVPYLLETGLKKQGASYQKAKIPFRPYVQVDGQLVTGQNPQSAKRVAEAVLNMID